jgi:MFS superfamily sulfate permease-like transporter
MGQLDVDDLETAIKQLHGVLGCVVLSGVDGQPSEIQAFTKTGTDREEVQALILEEINRRDLTSPVNQVYVFELEAESYFGDLESLERAVEFAEQEARTRGPMSPIEKDRRAEPSIDDTGSEMRPVLQRVSLTSSSWSSEAHVALASEVEEVVGRATSEKTPHGLKVLAEATLEAVSSLVSDVEFTLKSASLVNVTGHEAILVVVEETGGLEMLGAALTRGGPLAESAVRATLDAVNRRLIRR